MALEQQELLWRGLVALVGQLEVGIALVQVVLEVEVLLLAVGKVVGVLLLVVEGVVEVGRCLLVFEQVLGVLEVLQELLHSFFQALKVVEEVVVGEEELLQVVAVEVPHLYLQMSCLQGVVEEVALKSLLP